jgi:hypothetical protein
MRQRPGASGTNEKLQERRKNRREHLQSPSFSHQSSTRVERGSWEIEVASTYSDASLRSLQGYHNSISSGNVNTSGNTSNAENSVAIDIISNRDYRLFPHAYNGTLSDYGIKDFRHYRIRKAAKASGPFFTRNCCLNFCQLYSIVAFAFLIWIALMLDYQPLYIRGGLVKTMYQPDNSSRMKVHYKIPSPQSRSYIARVAYQTAFVYLLVALACYIALRPHITHYWRRRLYLELVDPKRRRRKSYGGGGDNGGYSNIDEMDDEIEDAAVLPHYYTVHNTGATRVSAMWRSTVDWMQQKMYFITAKSRARKRKKRRSSQAKKSG